MDAVCQTNIVGTRWDEPLIDPVVTEVALLGYAFALVKGYCVIGTCVDAGLASGALLIVHYHDTVISFDNCLFWAGIDTRGLVAVLTHVNTEDEVGSTTHHLGTILPNVDELDAVSGVVFLFTGHLAGLTSPAGLLIYEQGIVLHESSP